MGRHEAHGPAAVKGRHFGVALSPIPLAAAIP